MCVFFFLFFFLLFFFFFLGGGVVVFHIPSSLHELADRFVSGSDRNPRKLALYNFSNATRKSALGLSDRVRQNPELTATEDG